MDFINTIKKHGWYKKQSPLKRAILWEIAFTTIMALIFIPGYLIFSHINFRSLEKTDASKRLQQGQEFVQGEIDEVGSIAKEYANRTSTRSFVTSRDTRFIQESLNENIQEEINIDFVAILNSSGSVIHENLIDFDKKKTRSMGLNAGNLLKSYPELFSLNDLNKDKSGGIILQDDRLLLISSQPIQSTLFDAKQGGCLIFGRFLDMNGSDHLADITNNPIIFRGIDEFSNSREVTMAGYVLFNGITDINTIPVIGQCDACKQVITEYLMKIQAPSDMFLKDTENSLVKYSYLYDIEQKPVAIMGIQISPEIAILENKFTTYFLVTIISLLLVFGIIGVKLIELKITTEESLAEKYSLLRAVIDNVPDQIFAHDAQGRYLLNNLQDAKIIGVDDPELILGKSDSDFYPPELATYFLATEKNIVETGIPIINAEDVVVREDGQQHWILTTKTPMRDEDNRIIGIVGVAHDITDRKLRERELEAIALMSQALRAAETSTELLVMIYKQVITMLNVEFGTLELIDRSNGDAVIVYSYGAKHLFNGMRIPVNKGLNTRIRSTRKPLLVNNIADTPDILDLEYYEACFGLAGAPMIAEDELLGFLWIGRKSAISEYELRLLAAMADIAASSIRRMKLHEITENQLNKLTSLRNIDISINSSKDLHTTLGVLLDQTRTQLLADAADILLFNHETKSLECELGRGFHSELFTAISSRKSDGPAGLAAKTKKLVHIQNLAQIGATHPLAIAAHEEGFISYCAFPLLVRNQTKGVLQVFFRREFTPDNDWISFMETLAGQAGIAVEQVQLFEGLQQSNKDLILSYDETIEGWVRALDLRDKETEGHSLRVSQLCLELAIAMGINDDDLIHIRRGALLHDIGKVGVPDSILHKPGKLTEDEWVIMRGHPQFAYNMLSPIKYLEPALSIPYCHHERWDGTGYPRGIKGEEIPLEARIFSVIDVWDALSNDRPYRKAWNKDDALNYIKDQAGKQFDPKVVAYFLAIIPE